MRRYNFSDENVSVKDYRRVYVSAGELFFPKNKLSFDAIYIDHQIFEAEEPTFNVLRMRSVQSLINDEAAHVTGMRFMGMEYGSNTNDGMRKLLELQNMKMSYDFQRLPINYSTDMLKKEILENFTSQGFLERVRIAGLA